MEAVKELFRTLDTEDLRRVARTEPEEWDAYSYEFFDCEDAGAGEKEGRCLIGHCYGIECGEDLNAVRDKLHDPLNASAENEYLRFIADAQRDLPEKLMHGNYFRWLQYTAAYECIQLARQELHRREANHVLEEVAESFQPERTPVEV